MKHYLAIYWDAQNVRISPEKIELFNLWLNQQGDILINKAYAYWRKETEQFEKAIFDANFNLINVPSQEKNAVDHKMIHDCQNDIRLDSTIKRVILITGDQDYLTLVDHLKTLGLKVALISQHNVSERLKKTVNWAYNIDKLIHQVAENNLTKSSLDHSVIITYEDAKNCLIELIQTLKAEKKRATIALLGHLIKNHPRLSGYKKVSSIGKPDGKYFSKFSKFVEAVIKEGIIQNRNGELILVEI